MKLTDRETKHLREVVNYILEFEQDHYKEWVETKDRTGHVYYHAHMLIDVLRDWEEENNEVTG